MRAAYQRVACRDVRAGVWAEPETTPVVGAGRGLWGHEVLSVQRHEQMKRAIPSQRYNWKSPSRLECLPYSAPRKVNRHDQKVRGRWVGRRCGGAGELKWNLKDSALNILKHRLRSSGESTQQVATLCDHRLTGHQRPFQALQNGHTSPMEFLASVQKPHDYAGVYEHRSHLPNPCRCFLFEPRSGRPEANRPTPMTRCAGGPI